MELLLYIYLVGYGVTLIILTIALLLEKQQQEITECSKHKLVCFSSVLILATSSWIYAFYAIYTLLKQIIKK